MKLRTTSDKPDGRVYKHVDPVTKKVDYSKPKIRLYNDKDTEVVDEVGQALLKSNPNTVFESTEDIINIDDTDDTDDTDKFDLERIIVGQMKDFSMQELKGFCEHHKIPGFEKFKKQQLWDSLRELVYFDDTIQ